MTEESSRSLTFPLHRQRPVALASVLWLGFGILACIAYSRAHAGLLPALRLLITLWTLAVLNLIALAGLFFTLARQVTHPVQNRWRAFFPASYWGVSKLACAGLFLTILYQARGVAGTAALGMFLGLGTLAFVPIAGGLGDFLSHKET